MTVFSELKKRAREWDGADPLHLHRDAFAGLSDRLIYLDGNSLGPLPHEAARLLNGAIEVEWGGDLIRSWNKVWYDLPIRLGDHLAPLIGAKSGEVCFADSVTVNLYKLSSGILSAAPGRNRVVTDTLNFPSDLHALQGLKRTRPSLDVVVIDPDNHEGDATKAIIDSINRETAFVTLSHVVFKSGYLHDLRAIVEAAHQAGAYVLADISHSVGSVPMDLDEWGVDMAVGCSYKYLNGGPGAPAFLYVRKDLQEKIQPSLIGWFGVDDPFAFNETWQPAPGIRRFLVGTPPILSLRAIEPGINLLREAGMPAIREKSCRLTNLFIELHDAHLEPLGFRLGSPRDESRRGSHVSLQHKEALRISKALIEPVGSQPVIIPDFRRPDNLRFGFAPLYNQYVEVVRAVERIAEIVNAREYERFEESADPVT